MLQPNHSFEGTNLLLRFSMDQGGPDEVNTPPINESEKLQGRERLCLTSAHWPLCL